MASQGEKVVTMKLLSGKTKSLYKNELLSEAGGFSRIFEGSLKNESRKVAIKIITIDPWFSWQKLRNLVSPRFWKKPKSIESVEPVEKQQSKGDDQRQPEQKSGGDNRQPGKLSIANIKQEISVLKLFQDNQFVLELIGVCNFAHEIWIVTELGVGTAKDFVYELSKYLEVGDSLKMAVHMLAPIANALVHMHERGFIHRDMKLSNVIITNLGVPKLIDFGLCAKLSTANKYSPKHSAGSPFYMAPEAVRKEPVGPEGDAFAFGISMVMMQNELITEESLFSLNPDWEALMSIYVWNGEDIGEVQTFLNNKVKGLVNEDEPWEVLKKCVQKMICFDVNTRGTLQDIVKVELFALAMEEWQKYPCQPEQLSEVFKRQHAFISRILEDANQAPPLLLDFKPYFSIDFEVDLDW